MAPNLCPGIESVATGSGLASGHQAQHFARLAFGDDFERPAADLAIRSETLRRNAGVDDQLKSLAAERALNVR